MDDIQAPSTDGSENQDPRLIVSRGYDTLKGRYHEWTTANDPRYRVEYLHYLLDLLPSGANVLELGCGSGLPVARAVSENHSYIGVDISEEQLKLARKNAPQGRYVKADMSAIAFHRESLDAVVAFYSIFHVPRARPRNSGTKVGPVQTYRPQGWNPTRTEGNYGDKGKAASTGLKTQSDIQASRSDEQQVWKRGLRQRSKQRPLLRQKPNKASLTSEVLSAESRVYVVGNRRGIS